MERTGFPAPILKQSLKPSLPQHRVRTRAEPQNITSPSFNNEEAAAFVAETRKTAEQFNLISPPPLVSIVTATKNRADILPSAVRSVLAQSYANWELLVVDGGSTGETEVVTRSFADPRIRYIRGNYQGAASARNIGLKKAGGALIAYLDSDYQWVPEFLEMMVGFLRSSDLEIAYCGKRMESDSGVQYRGGPFELDDLVRVNCIDLNSILHKRELINRLGSFDETLGGMIDWDLIIRFAKEAKIGYAPFIGLIFVDHKQRSNRSTIQDSIYLEYAIMNRYLIDWDDLQSKTHERERDLVSIIVPVHGNLKVTNNCLESIYSNLPNSKFEIIIVNNKSDDATRANIVLWQQARSNIKVVSNWTNLNFALGCNIGFAHSQGGTVIFLNNDTLVTPGWLDRLVDQLIDPTIGAVQPKLLYPDGTVQSIGAVFSDVGTISHMLYRGEPGNSRHVNRRRRLQAGHGACLAVQAQDFASLHGFDAHFINGQEDIDFCLRLTAETDKMVLVDPKAVVIHLEGKTPGRSRYVRQNRALFLQRWKGRIRPDDRAVYAEDGFFVGAYEADKEDFALEGIAVYSPSLIRAPLVPGIHVETAGETTS